MIVVYYVVVDDADSRMFLALDRSTGHSYPTDDISKARKFERLDDAIMCFKNIKHHPVNERDFIYDALVGCSDPPVKKSGELKIIRVSTHVECHDDYTVKVARHIGNSDWVSDK